MIAITFALPAESSDFVKLLENRNAISREGVEIVRGIVRGKPVAVIHTGVGSEECRERMEVVLRREKFSYLISAGFAGALEPELKIGNVLVAENYSTPELVGSPSLELNDDGTFLGKLLTVPRMVEGGEERESLAKKTGAVAVDMETGVIAEMCAAHNLPMLSARAISDTIADPFPAPAEVLFDVARQQTNFVRLGSYLLTHPSAFRRLNAFRERIAAARKSLTATLEKIVAADLP
jgi:adenosylhomocysteine nucleosidase